MVKDPQKDAQVWNSKFCTKWYDSLHDIPLTLIYPAHFEDVPCQSGVNHIYEG